MANSKYNEIKNHKLYIIFHEQTLQFFIGISAAMDLSNIFSKHYSMRDECTKDLFNKYRETIYCPRMYLLQKVSCTLEEAQSRQIAFIRLFHESGYTSLNKDYIKDFTNDLDEYTEEIYNCISEKTVEEYLSDSNVLCANYGRKRKDKNENPYTEGKKQVKFFCTEEEYEIIKEISKKNNKTVSAYLRQVALQGKVMDIGYQQIREHTDTISRLKNIIILVVKLFASTKEIYDSDIEKIVDLMKSIDDSETKLLREYLKHNEKTRKEIKKELRKMISSNT